MNDFKVGDRVKYVGHYDIRPLGTLGTVVIDGATNKTTVRVRFDDDGRVAGVFPASIQRLPTPDIITINRADLPEVSAEYEASNFPGKDVPRVALAALLAGGWGSADDAVRSLRSVIAGYEGSIKFDLERAAEKEAADKLNKRRDELAREVAKKSCHVNWQMFTYADIAEYPKAAIDMMIAAEADRG